MTRILVTGGSRGIGRAICLRIAQDARKNGKRAKIVVSATGQSGDLDHLVEELKAAGADALGLAGDLNDPAVPARLIERTVDFCGGLDAVVHNAGGAIGGTLLKTKVADWDTVFAVNCRAFFLLGQAAHPSLRDSKGSMCAIGSTSSELVGINTNAYPPAKAALKMLVQQMAYEWGRYGIRVNCVSPGITMSRSTEIAFADPDDKLRAGARIPLKRVGEAEDVASVVAFIIGPDAAYVTGENINVDGGVRHVTMEGVLDKDSGDWVGQHAAMGKMRVEPASN